ncbi:MAG: hypothetical protein ACTSYC_03230 [Promethearchaeota archaeon]
MNPFSEIHIDKKDIFIRNKYEDILNYIKLIITSPKETELLNGLKLKGALLLHVPEGTDIIEYIKLIAKNYYLNILELDFIEISKNPLDFFTNFSDYFRRLLEEIDSSHEEIRKKEQEQENGDNASEELENVKTILLINENKSISKYYKDKSLIEQLIMFNLQLPESIDFIKKGLILIWISHKMNDIIDNSIELLEVFDLFIKIPLLNEIERETYLKEFLENNKEITFHLSHVLNETKDWEIKELTHLLRLAIIKYHLKFELNDVSNEITEVINDIINAEELIPLNAKKSEKIVGESIDVGTSSERKEMPTIQPLKQVEKEEGLKSFLKELEEKKYHEFLSEQLYEEAASKNYEDLVIIIEKLNKNEILEDNAKKILANYPFILADTPTMAQIKLEKAKKKVDFLKQAFKK